MAKLATKKSSQAANKQGITDKSSSGKNKNKRTLHKEQKKREITALLYEQSPMEPCAIARAISDLSLPAVNRYLDELLVTGHIRKVSSTGKRKNIRAYAYQSIYGAKTDILSLALSHPLHLITLSIAGKNHLPSYC